MNAPEERNAGLFVARRDVCSRLLACPACRSSLLQTECAYECPACGTAYPVSVGIPSFCVPAAILADEAALTKRMLGIYAHATFAELAEARVVDGPPVSEDQRLRFTEYSVNSHARGARFHRMFREKAGQAGWPVTDFECVVDVGCGTGSGLLALASQFEWVVGIDISMSSLVAAAKLMEENAITNVILLHASAQRLPLQPAVAGYATAVNVLEHVFDPAGMLAEVYRILQPGGVFCADSRNRYDLLFPEPHVKLRWVGFLPRRWMAPYVRWRLGVGYDHTHLLSYADLSGALHSTFGAGARIILPDLATYGVPPAIGRRVEWLAGLPGLAQILVRLSPSHLAIGHRSRT